MLKSAILSGLMGVAVGDALGVPVEYEPPYCVEGGEFRKNS